MKNSTVRTVLLAALVLLLNVEVLLAADPGDQPATCSISVTVNTMMEWAGNFSDISLTAIADQADAPEGSQTQTLYTNCNLEISADNTTAARLSSAADSLVTKYKLTYDGDGSAATGGSGVTSWTDYSTFLSSASAVTHVNTDGAVQISLYVQATNPAGRVPDAGSYNATQTLTASWTSD